jgi:hypothetical protein
VASAVDGAQTATTAESTNISRQESTRARATDSRAPRREGPPRGCRWPLLARISCVDSTIAILFHPDQGGYAEASREIVASGDWGTAHLTDLQYFERPPLPYWATAIAGTASGDNAWTVGLRLATLDFLGLFAALVAGKMLDSPGLVAGLVLASRLHSCSVPSSPRWTWA